MELVEGRKYLIATQSNEMIEAKLEDIKRYPAGGLPPDFLFIRISGPDKLCFKNRKIEDCTGPLAEHKKAYTLRMQKECPEGFYLPEFLINELIENKLITAI